MTRAELARALALFFGALGLLHLGGGILVAGFDANAWWLDARRLPGWLADALLGLGCAAMLAHALRPATASWRRWASLALVGVLGLAALGDTVAFYDLLCRGRVRAGVPVPLSVFVAAGLALIAQDIGRPQQPRQDTGPAWRRVAVAVVAVAIAFPLAQMLCYGKTDYRRPAEVAIVFGAGVRTDGSCSDALRDRVATGCELYHQGLVRRLLFTGGPGPGAVHEVEGMRRLAVQLGVPATAIELDTTGIDTQASIAGTTALLRRAGVRKALAVSHFYHLPRIRIAYQRAGWEVPTVPATESYWLSAMPWYLAREVVAFWAYHLRPLAAV